MHGRLYDDFRICDVATHDVIFTVVPRSGHDANEHQAQLWGAINNFKEPIVASSNWKQLLANLPQTLVD